MTQGCCHAGEGVQKQEHSCREPGENESHRLDVVVRAFLLLVVQQFQWSILVGGGKKKFVFTCLCFVFLFQSGSLGHCCLFSSECKARL